MAGASYILAVNLFIAALFALAFLLVALHSPSGRHAGWFALAYGFGIAYVLTEFLLPMQGDPALVYTLSFGAFLGAVASITVGVARRYRVAVPWMTLLVVIGGSLLANWYGYTLGRELILRQFLYQGPYALMQVIAAIVVLRSGRRQSMDIGLIALFGLSAVQFVSKPLLAMLTGGTGATPAGYIVSNYALYSQSLGAILQVATGLLMLMVLVRDMLVEITARSETDMLSELYNRRGFDAHALPALAASVQATMPTALIAVDLDGFKQINDTYGHDSGDVVIAAFGALLRDLAPANAVSARMGGEEFAILLPGSNLAMARLLAEALRTGFARRAIKEVPSEHTASFGVAEHASSESLAELRRRADSALYAAKRGGRDRVHLATDPTADAMPIHPLSGTSLSRDPG